MSEFETMVMMFCGFALVVLAGHAYTQRLRRRGYGPQLDALYFKTRRLQGRILYYISIFLGSLAPQQDHPHRPPEAGQPARSSGTKQE